VKEDDIVPVRNMHIIRNLQVGDHMQMNFKYIASVSINSHVLPFISCLSDIPSQPIPYLAVKKRTKLAKTSALVAPCNTPFAAAHSDSQCIIMILSAWFEILTIDQVSVPNSLILDDSIK
jgi:hypothetical protein